MKGKETFDHSINLPRMGLLYSGVDTYKNSKHHFIALFWNRLLFPFNLSWLYMDSIGGVMWLIDGLKMGKSIIELSKIAPCSCVTVLSTMKTLPLYIDVDAAIRIIGKLRDLHPICETKGNEKVSVTKKNETEIKKYEKDEESNVNGDKKKMETKKKENNEIIENFERDLVNKTTKFLIIIVKIFSMSCVMTTVAFSVMPLLSMAYEYFTTGEVELKYPFLVKYFFDSFTPTRYPFVYAHQLWSNIVVTMSIFSTDSLLYAFCTYIEMHFRILSKRFECLNYGSTYEDSKKNLFPLLHRHQELIKLVNDVEDLYTNSILFNMLTSSVLICLCGLNITVPEDIGTVLVFITFMSMSVSQTALLCFFGDMIMTSSVEVSEAVYKSTWYSADNHTKKILQIVLIRAQEPCKLTAAKFADLKLIVFSAILSRSWSYFALLRTMYD